MFVRLFPIPVSYTHLDVYKRQVQLDDIACQIQSDVYNDGCNACPGHLKSQSYDFIRAEFFITQTDQRNNNHGRQDRASDSSERTGDSCHAIADDHRGIDWQRSGGGLGDGGDIPVSYTHLDVYKRQALHTP